MGYGSCCNRNALNNALNTDRLDSLRRIAFDLEAEFGRFPNALGYVVQLLRLRVTARELRH